MHMVSIDRLKLVLYLSWAVKNVPKVLLLSVIDLLPENIERLRIATRTTPVKADQFF